MKTLLLLFIIITLNAQAQTSQWLWGQEGSTSIKAVDYGSNVATDKQGNAYVTGQFMTTVTFGSFTLTTQSSGVPFLVKYNAQGTAEWATCPNSLNGGYGIGFGVATDPSGNIFVTGILHGGPFVFGNDTLNSDSLGFDIINAFLVKYDPNGNVLWAKQSNSFSYSNYYPASNSVACDNFGNVYITGYFQYSIQFGSYKLTLPSEIASFLTKYDSNGNVLWAQQSTGPGIVASHGVITCSGGEYITGSFEDAAYFGADTLTQIAADSVYYYPGYGVTNVFIAKYDTSGNALWARQSSGPFINFNIDSIEYLSAGYSDAGFAVTSDSLGNAYIGGIFYDSIQFGSQPLYTPDNAAFLVKYNSSGDVLWAKASTGEYWTGTSLALDNANHIYYGGNGTHSLYDEPGTDSMQWGHKVFSTDIVSSAYASFILMLDTSGNALCGVLHANGAGLTSYIYFTGVASDSTGAYIYEAGSFVGDLFCGPDTLTSYEGGNTVYVARWQACPIGAGINELKEKNEELTVYPNPFHSSATIMLNTQSSISDVHYLEIDDITGRQLKWIEFNGEQYELSAAGIASGLYFIRAFDREKNVTGVTKIVVR